MLSVYIKSQRISGYDKPGYSWDCPLCYVSEPVNLDKGWVERRALGHMHLQHNALLKYLQLVDLVEEGLGDAASLEDRQAEVLDFERRLRELVNSSCPGDHNPVQHRDSYAPWCRSCGRTALGDLIYVVAEKRYYR